MQLFLLWWLFALAGLLATSAWLLWRAESSRAPNHASLVSAPARTWPPLLVLCPLSRGDSVDAWGQLALEQGESRGLFAYPGAWRVLFLADAREPEVRGRAADAAFRLTQAGIRSDVLLTHPAGRNFKAAQLASVPFAATKGHLVLSIDSDVDLRTVEATGLVSRLQAPDRAAAAWQATVPAGPVSPGDWLSNAVLTATLHAMPFVALMREREAVGKVLCYRPSALGLAGGWSPSIAKLGDDVCFSTRLHAMGEIVVACRTPAAIVLRREQKVRDVFARFVRWTRIVLEQRPSLLAAYPLFVCYLPLFTLACAAWWLAGAPLERPLLLLAAAVALRLAIASTVRHCCQQPGGSKASLLIESIAADLFLLVVCAAALCRPKVTWHGRVLSGANEALPAAQSPIANAMNASHHRPGTSKAAGSHSTAA